MDRWILSQVEQKANQLSNALGVRHAYVSATNKIVGTIRDHRRPANQATARKTLLKSKTVNLRSRKTDGFLEIVRRLGDGAMVIDANATKQTSFNTMWAVDKVDDDGERVRLHNSFNFLNFDQSTKLPGILHVPPEHCPPPDSCEWIVLECYDDRDFVILESAVGVGDCLGFGEKDGCPESVRDKLSFHCHLRVLSIEAEESGFVRE